METKTVIEKVKLETGLNVVGGHKKQYAHYSIFTLFISDFTAYCENGFMHIIDKAKNVSEPLKFYVIERGKFKHLTNVMVKYVMRC